MRMKVRDEDLAIAAGTGDRFAFSSLLERHYDRIYRVAYGVLGSKEDAEEVTQDICAGLPNKLTGFRGDARFTTWLYTVTINAARDLLRKRGTYDRAIQNWGEVDAMNRATSKQVADEVNWLNAAMQRLPQNLRETVALVLGEDMSHAEAAQALEISEGTVSWRMAQVRKTLAEFAREEGLVR